MAEHRPLEGGRTSIAQDDPFVLCCVTCVVSARLPLGSPAGFRDAARSFFLAHAECATSIDLDGRRLHRWVV